MGNAVYSINAEKIYDFLLLVGAAPFDAIAIATKIRKGNCNKGLNSLRGAGYAYPEKINGIEWWFLEARNSNVLSESQNTIAWFVARLNEAGGSYKNGIVKYPKGQEYSVEIVNKTCLRTGNIFFHLQDLVDKPLRECFSQK